MGNLSIIILYNNEIHSLIKTLDSIKSIKENPPQIIIAGDSSLASLEKQIKENYSFLEIQILQFPENTDISTRLNKSAQLSTCDFLTFILAGSILSISDYDSMITVINAQLEQTWCYGATQEYASNTYKIKPLPQLPAHRKEGFIFPYLFIDNQINLQSLIVPKKIFNDIQGFNSDYKYLYDVEFILRLALFYQPVFWDNIVVETYSQNLEPTQYIQEQLQLLYEFIEPAHTMSLKHEYLEDILDKISKNNLWQTFNGLLNVLSQDKICKDIIESFIKTTFVEQKIIPSTKNNISGVVDCVGCGSCSHRCPFNAITMEYNQEGFLYPHVNQELCVNCGECLMYCPTQNKLNSTACQDKCLAAMASDNYRENSSSGGIFPMLGEFFINNGGYVGGAVFSEGLDLGNAHVKHVVCNDLNDLEKMRSSKYVQSDTTKVYPQVEQLLQQGINVFFTGCACQIAGLKAYLRKDYPNLFTADVICHGSPSPGVFKNYIKELYDLYGPIDEISFRKKKIFGWSTGIYVKFKNGKTIIESTSNQYLYGFLNDWFLRKTCYNCPFKSRKYSDITLGDFWGISDFDENMNDHKGTSFIELNTHKGILLYKNVLEKLNKKLFMPISCALIQNPCIRRSVPENKFRKYFFDSWKNHGKSLATTLEHTGDNVHFDVAMVLMWSVNHGNAVTNYALYTILKRYCSVMVIDNCSTLRPLERFRKFADENYECSSSYFPDDRLDLIMDHCDTLLTGSDQIWNHAFESLFGYNTYYYLDFALDRNDIKKISYASSFGNYSQVPTGDNYTRYFEQFDKISVRDIFGPKACKEKHNLDAEFVLDPVFLLEENEYDNLIERVDPLKIETEPFILSYVLNPNQTKREACKKIQKSLGDIKIINVCEGDSGKDEYTRRVLEFDNIKYNVSVEDWLYYLKNAKFIITDSFHGTCFSVYFRKPFMSFVNRQSDRFLWFKELGQPYDHIITDITDENIEKCLHSIDYDKVWDILNRERTRSLSWLKEALQSPKKK